MADYSQGPIGGPQPNAPHYNAVPFAEQNNEFMSQKLPPYPKWIIYLLFPALVLSIGVLGMMAYVAHSLQSGAESIGFNIFAGVWGLIVTTYIILALTSMQSIHYKWVVFILAVVSSIWWLVAFAWLASTTRSFFQLLELYDSLGSYSDIYGSYDSYFSTISSRLAKRQYYGSSYVSGLVSTLRTSASVMAGGAAIGAIIWVLWLVFTAFYAIALFRGFERAGAPAAAHPMGPAPVYEQKTNIPPPPQQQQPSAYPAVPAPVGTPAPASAPIRPDPAYDPRQQGHFMTPPPPQASPSPAPYANPQFSYPQQAYEMPSPITPVSAPAANPNIAEMPAGK